MKQWMPDFRNDSISGPPIYDIEYDRELIEQSIAKQYHILPSNQGDLTYSDWTKLVSGIMDDTPLGRVVQVRTETDAKIIAKFSPEQKRIRQEWSAFLASKAKEDAKKADGQEKIKKEIAGLEQMLAGLFGGGG